MKTPSSVRKLFRDITSSTGAAPDYLLLCPVPGAQPAIWEGPNQEPATPRSPSALMRALSQVPRGSRVAGAQAPWVQGLGDPHLTDNKLNGVIKFDVVSARVLQADNIVPRPDGTMTSFLFRGHTIVHFPNGEVVNTEHCDAITGCWYQGHLRQINISPWSSGIDTVFGTPTLDNLDSAIVAKTQEEIRNAHDLLSLRFALNLPSSLFDLLYHFRGHDLVNTQYDFTSWQRANQIAMHYVDAAFGASGGPMPWEVKSNHPDSDAPPRTTPPQLGQGLSPLSDRVTITITPAISFSIPVTDPKWAYYKGALPQLQFDADSWSAMAQEGASRLQMEKRLFVEINASLDRAQKVTLAGNQPVINELAQAAYLAKQPGATLRQKNEYVMLRSKDDPILDQSTRYLMAVQMLLRFIQDDITSQTGGN